MRREVINFRNSQDMVSSLVLTFCIFFCLRDTKDCQTEENCISQGMKEQRQRMEVNVTEF